ncbi:sugar MFS transporter [Aestuariibacter sp. AA17]|uniref:Sugar MFS transporter n=1 Tax=Fluctibacter corallii TaxID=2984329 RepID=A0ABT3A560_9ALTE|nr:sugar MFS transporter [Aestuariibacter sp. AA17]MCV2883753.1 sugar MFS transporter [Aestuariibacter sp. AA17]
MNVKTESLSVSHSNGFAIMSIGLLFFIFGFVTWLNGALIPFLQMVCQLTEVQALFIAFCFYFAYVVMALPMARILEKTGYQKGMSLGLFMIAFGCVLFVPAALTQTFAIFLAAQFVVGSGLTILQTASNPFIVRLGSEDSAAARIAFMGLLNKAAGAIAPLAFTALVLGNFDDVNQVTLLQMSIDARDAKLEAMSMSLIVPYIWMAIALTVLGAVFSRIPLPEISKDIASPSSSPAPSSSLTPVNASDADNSPRLRHYPHLILGAITLFFYVGVEVIAGDTIGLYGSSLGMDHATSLTSYTMTAMVMGYVIGLIYIPKYLSQQKALLASAILGMVLTLAIAFASNTAHGIADLLWGWSGVPTVPNSIALIALLGLANALVWPAVWPLALSGLGALTPKGSALLIMGIAGGAILPLVYGGAASWVDSQKAYLIMLPCYGFIAYYAISGHKKRCW